MSPQISPPDLDRLADLGEYHLLEKLGEGGMGAVYRAIHTRLDKVVAVKMLPAGGERDDQLTARFDREMKAIGRLNHPNIVQAYDARQIGTTRFLVMEYIEGVDLSKLAARRGRLEIADACEAIRQAALGLQAAHEHGLVHRDIKLSNLMLTDRGTVKVLDLGLARFRSEPAAGDELTASGQIMGTVEYMAPEQVSDCRHVDIRADIYSLGCALYKLLSGKTPFDDPQNSTPMNKMVARLLKAARPVRQVRGDVPAALAAVVERMLAKKPESRFSTPAAAADALLPFAAGADLAALCAKCKRDAEKNGHDPAKTGDSSDRTETREHSAAGAAEPTGTGRKLAALCRETDSEHLGNGGRRRGPRSPRRLAAIAAAVCLATVVPAVAWRYVLWRRHSEIIPPTVVESHAGIPAPAAQLPTGVKHAPTASRPAAAPAPASAPFDAMRAREYQEAWAKHLGVAVSPVNSIGMKLVLIPPGTFDMGSAAPSANEVPIHRIRLTRPFYLGAYEVTQAEYERIVGRNPSHFQSPRPPSQAAGQLPVESVSWEEAQVFCNRLSALPAEKTAGRVYRLPTEAEWEYACRAGAASAYFFGDDPARLNDYAWFDLRDAGATHPVGGKQANAWQLHDMLGNVYEWCSDLYDARYYGNSPANDPGGPAEGLQRVIRGGSWFGGAAFCRAAARVGAQPDGNEQIGFRVLCQIAPPRAAGGAEK